MKPLLCASIILIAAGPALAATSYDAAAVATGTSASEVHALGESHVVMRLESAYESMNTMDPANPMAGMSGTCFGAVELIGMSASGGGNCVFSGDMGGMVALRWIAEGLGEGGAITGRWLVTGGSGAYAGMSGGGGFSSVTDPETGQFENSIDGAIVMP